MGCPGGYQINLISQGIKNIITPQQKGKVPTTVQQTTKALNSTLSTLLSHSGVESLLDPQTPETLIHHHSNGPIKHEI